MLASLTPLGAGEEGWLPRQVTRSVIAVVVALLLVVAAAGYLWWRHSDQTVFARAVAAAPAGTERVSWTDWAGVRREVGADVDARSSAREVRDFLDRGFEDDLTSTSALVQSASVLQDSFGFSPASADWELFSQASDGAAVVLRMPDESDMSDIGDRLEELGYPRPAEEGGVWAGGPDVLSAISPDLTPELGYVVLLADEHLVLTSDQEAYVRVAADAARDDGSPRGRAVVGGGRRGDRRCRRRCTAATTPAGRWPWAGPTPTTRPGPPSWSPRPEPSTRTSRSRWPGLTTARYGWRWSSPNDDQARANADSRAALATGPAVGQGGDFADRFTLDKAKADGSLVTLDLSPSAGRGRPRRPLHRPGPLRHLLSSCRVAVRCAIAR